MRNEVGSTTRHRSLVRAFLYGTLLIFILGGGLMACLPSIPVAPGGNAARAAAHIWLLDPILKIPSDTATESLLKPPKWLEGSTGDEFDSYAKLKCAVAPHVNAAACVDEPEWSLVAEFLHTSDAQVRDQALHRDAAHKRELRRLDGFVRVSVRNSNVEEFDSLILAAQLAAYARGEGNCASGNGVQRFIVHTGDLLDTSVVSELMTSLWILDEVESAHPCPIYSLGGNHDGLTFGNLADAVTDTHGLGVNRSEFVLGHVAMSGARTNAFGFGGNEVIAGLNETDANNFRCPDLDTSSEQRCDDGETTWCGCVKEQLDDVLDSLRNAKIRRRNTKKDRDKPWPVAKGGPFRELIHVSSLPDTYGLQLGYYSVPPAAGAQLPVRLVMLDTRDGLAYGGDLSLVQLGWLYNELRAANDAGEIVLLFAHHKPDEIKCPGGPILRRMLDRFHNIGGYFYGHVHWNIDERYDKGFWMIQTGSLVDYPELARDVRVYAQRSGDGARVHITSHFWRPTGETEGNGKTAAGLTLESMLGAARRDARKEHNDSNSGIFHMFDGEYAVGGTLEHRDKAWVKGMNANPKFTDHDSEVVLCRPAPSAAEVFQGRLNEAGGERAYLAELGVTPIRLDPPGAPSVHCGPPVSPLNTPSHVPCPLPEKSTDSPPSTNGCRDGGDVPHGHGGLSPLAE